MSATSKTTPSVFVGTYTEFEGSQSEGVYVHRMDASSGKLALDKVVKAVINPSFLEIHPERQYLYVVDEVQTYGGQTVTALPREFQGENLCADIHISPKGKYLYASNRGHDSIVCFSIDENTGKLTYQGEIPSGGKEPRGFAIDPTGNFMLAAHERSDNMVIFKIDLATGRLSRTGQELKISHPVCQIHLLEITQKSRQ